MEADDEKRTKGRRQEKGEGFRGMTEGEGEGMRIHAGVALLRNPDLFRVCLLQSFIVFFLR